MKLLALFLLLLLTSCSGTRPTHLGIQENGRFAPCPDKPNCVQSESQKEEHRFPTFRTTSDSSWVQLVKVIQEQPRTDVISEKNQNYLHAEATSALWRFVDDIEVILDKEQLYFKSASRLGYSDMGVNRERLETLTKQLLTLKVIKPDSSL